jgi:hypothetical protein
MNQSFNVGINIFGRIYLFLLVVGVQYKNCTALF